jgi:hypothetical protein
MRDFEEEELLVREGNGSDDVDALVARSTSQTQISSPQVFQFSREHFSRCPLSCPNYCAHPDPTMKKPGRSISVRVLLSAKEAAELDLHFGIDGVPANVEIKVQYAYWYQLACLHHIHVVLCVVNSLQSRELIERFAGSDDKDPITIARWLPDIVAVGTSIHSSRAKIITMKLQPRGSASVGDAAYQFDTVTSMESLLSALVARLYQQFKGRIVICNCASCGALSLLTPKYPGEADGALVVYSCLLCSSCNVRETSFKKLVAICANEGVAIPSSIPLAPPPWETITEGFYVEEPAAVNPTAGSGMRECVMISCNGIREVAAPSIESGTRDEGHSDELNDAIVHAMATSMR